MVFFLESNPLILIVTIFMLRGFKKHNSEKQDYYILGGDAPTGSTLPQNTQ